MSEHYGAIDEWILREPPNTCGVIFHRWAVSPAARRVDIFEFASSTGFVRTTRLDLCLSTKAGPIRFVITLYRFPRIHKYARTVPDTLQLLMQNTYIQAYTYIRRPSVEQLVTWGDEVMSLRISFLGQWHVVAKNRYSKSRETGSSPSTIFLGDVCRWWLQLSWRVLKFGRFIMFY